MIKMKKHIITLWSALIFLIGTSYGQDFVKHELHFSPFGISDVGKTGFLDYSYGLNPNWRINVGLRYLHSKDHVLPDTREYWFRKRFDPSKPIQNFGLGLGAEYHTLIHKYVDVFAFYDLTFLRSDTKAHRFEYIGERVGSGGVIDVYKKIDMNYFNVNSLEHKIGIGLNAKIRGSLYLTARAGVGINMIGNLPKAHFDSGGITEASFIYSVGLNYKFKN